MDVVNLFSLVLLSVLCSPGLARDGRVHLILHDCGCWKDSPEYRAIPDVDHHLGGNYETRADAVQECGRLAKSKGHIVFAVQDGGRCKTGPTASDDFMKYGPSYDCSRDGKGGYLANQVYRINLDYELNYRLVGCYADDRHKPAIPSAEKRFIRLHDDYKERIRAIRFCGEAALGNGFKIFAVQDGGRCMLAPDAGKTYDRYGESYDCKPDGRGGPWANAVYEITDGNRISVTNLGCFKHTPGSVPTLENKGVLDERTNFDTIEQCIRYAASLGLRTVSLVNGFCHSSKNADVVYTLNGRSPACKNGGEGGSYAANVYNIEVDKVVTVQYWGCWADDVYGTMPSVEGRSPSLSDNYKTREEALEKCAGYAASQGFDTFALQDGGMCCTGADARQTYRRIRPAENCGEDQKGGKKSNSVYYIIPSAGLALAPGKPYVNTHVLCALSSDY